MTKQVIMELALNEQLRERQEMEKKLLKFAKTMDHLGRAKREEAAPLIESAFKQRLAEEAALHEREQQVCIKVTLCFLPPHNNKYFHIFTTGITSLWQPSVHEKNFFHISLKKVIRYLLTFYLFR